MLELEVEPVAFNTSLINYLVPKTSGRILIMFVGFCELVDDGDQCGTLRMVLRNNSRISIKVMPYHPIARHQKYVERCVTFLPNPALRFRRKRDEADLSPDYSGSCNR